MLKSFLRFRCMITPMMVELSFWAGVLMCIINGIKTMQIPGEWLQGLFIILIGPIVLRVLCEVMMIFFRIYESLRDIHQALKQETISAP